MDVIFTLAGLLGVSGIIGTFVTRYVRPKATPMEILQEVQEERDKDRIERDKDRARIDALEAGRREDRSLQRTTINYVHVLREHIVEGNPPPPPPWPEGLNR